MNSSDEKFLKKLLATFKEEAGEHIRIISSSILELEKNEATPAGEKIIETIFREAHSLKGAARSVNLENIELLCRSLEIVFNSLKQKEIYPTKKFFDLLNKVMDFLSKLLSEINLPVDSPEAAKHKKQLVWFQAELEDYVSTNKIIQSKRSSKKDNDRIKPSAIQVSVKASAEAQSEIDEQTISEKIRISIGKLDSLLLQAEELLPTKLSMTERVSELQMLSRTFDDWKKERNKISDEVRSRERKLKKDSVTGKQNGSDEKIIEYIKWSDAFLKMFEHNLQPVIVSVKRDQHSFSLLVDGLLEEVKKTLMLPISHITEIFPKMVRELARDRDKEVNLIINGSEIEVDRRILEEIKNPLIHLIRNCIDHGIEKPKERLQKKKSTAGGIRIDITQKDSGKVEIKINDDGAGINYNKVYSSAVKLNIISDQEKNKMSPDQLHSLIFHSGVTTSDVISDISGRGLGLAIVKEKVEKLGGKITVESKVDVGTSFQIILPLTLATFRGIFVLLAKDTFIFPISYIERVLRIKKEEIKTVENKDTIQVNGHVISLVNLSDLLEIAGKNLNANEQPDFYQIVILSCADKSLACIVDEIVGVQEVLVKSFNKQLSNVKYISGATILGNGKVVPILNVFDLMKTSAEISSAVISVEAKHDKVSKAKSVLVVEDSITARTLLQGILESAGYKVSTATDGIDAFTQIKTNEFDIVVSDVDMPRMSGFDLTAKIRSEEKFANLPVILVTALESREYRERGIDVGANAYIVKSGFDQTNLLETIRRLI